MSELMKWLSRAGLLIITWLCRALGGWDAALGLLFLVMGLDLATGLLCAFHHKSDKTQGGGFLSRSFFLGLTRKLMMLVLVMLATALDYMLGSDGVARLAVIGFYAANEGLSILENAALLGLPLPEVLVKALERVKGEETGREKVGEEPA